MVYCSTRMTNALLSPSYSFRSSHNFVPFAFGASCINYEEAAYRYMYQIGFKL